MVLILLINRLKVHGLTEVADGKDASAVKGVKAKWSYYRSLITATKEDHGGIFYAPPISDARHIDGGEGIIVELLDYVGETDLKFVFKKCTLASVDGINLGYAEGDKIMPTFTFKAKQIQTYFRE